jgi:hypothetical protein
MMGFIAVVIFSGGVALYFQPDDTRRELNALRAEATQVRMKRLQLALHRYHRIYDAFPEGDMPAVIAQLAGANPKGLIFCQFDSTPAIEARDKWGQTIEIGRGATGLPRLRSGGADRRSGTADDIVVGER